MQSQYRTPLAEQPYQGFAMECEHTNTDPQHSQFVCHCLEVTEADLVTTIAANGLCTLQELRREIGAGDGCTACHHLLKAYLAKHAGQDAAVAVK